VVIDIECFLVFRERGKGKPRPATTAVRWKLVLERSVVALEAGERNKKTDVAEHPEAFRHVGLLFNETPGAGRGSLYLVIRRGRTAWKHSLPLSRRHSI